LPAAQQDLSHCIHPFIQALPVDKAKLLNTIDLEGQSQKQLANVLVSTYANYLKHAAAWNWIRKAKS